MGTDSHIASGKNPLFLSCLLPETLYAVIIKTKRTRTELGTPGTNFSNHNSARMNAADGIQHPVLTPGLCGQDLAAVLWHSPNLHRDSDLLTQHLTNCYSALRTVAATN